MIKTYRIDPIAWPEKRKLFGLGISLTTYRRIVRVVLEAAWRAGNRLVSPCPCRRANQRLARAAGKGESLPTLVAPDGQPVRWAVNWLRGAGFRDRVCGPDSMLALCRRAAKAGISVFLYGSSPEVVADLQANLAKRIRGLQIAGAISPPFRPLTPAEDEAIVAEINASGAGIVFIGLGFPKQDLFADAHRDRIRAVQVCVGRLSIFMPAARRGRAGCERAAWNGATAWPESPAACGGGTSSPTRSLSRGLASRWRVECAAAVETRIRPA